MGGAAARAAVKVDTNAAAACLPAALKSFIVRIKKYFYLRSKEKNCLSTGPLV